MLLEEQKSICEKFQKIIVSEENGRSHRAVNSEEPYAVRHYHLDGGIIHQKKCCDYLLLNDTKKDAYFIELKGINIDDAIPQLESALSIVRDEISDYKFIFRIVCNGVRTHKLQSSKFRSFKDKYKGNVKCATRCMEEAL